MDHKIIGTTMPVLEINLGAGESVVAESGELSWMTSAIELHTAAGGKAGAKGVFGAMKRAIGGGTLFMTEYTAQAATGMVAFATKVPGQIMQVALNGGTEYMVHRGGYLCGVPSVNLEIGFQQKIGAGLFGGEGFILQRVSGEGDAWIELDGEIVTYDLPAGESIRVQPGHVGMFERSVAFELDRIKGIKNIIFGGDLFLAKLTGPGKVWLQTMPLANLAHAIAPYLPQQSNGGDGGAKVSFGGLSFGSDS
jgi:uncharacterized protein (TIGR00266 family)